LAADAMRHQLIAFRLLRTLPRTICGKFRITLRGFFRFTSPSCRLKPVSMDVLMVNAMRSHGRDANAA